MPNGTVYNAIFLNFLLRLIFPYLNVTLYGKIDYYCTWTQNVIKTKYSVRPFWISKILKGQNDTFWQIPIYSFYKSQYPTTSWNDIQFASWANCSVCLLQWGSSNEPEAFDRGIRLAMQHLLVCAMMNTAYSIQDLTMVVPDIGRTQFYWHATGGRTRMMMTGPRTDLRLVESVVDVVKSRHAHSNLLHGTEHKRRIDGIKVQQTALHFQAFHDESCGRNDTWEHRTMLPVSCRR